MYNDLREFIEVLDRHTELIRVRERLSPKYEIPAVVKYLTRSRNRALFFDDVEGYSVPVAANLLGAKGRLALALGVPESDIPDKYLSSRQNLIKPDLVSDGPAKQVEIRKDVDITRVMPVLTHHAKDASPYFTCAVTLARDPETGIRGMGIHRIQVKDRNTLGIFLASPPLSHFLARAEAKGMPLEIAVVVGIDPITFFASVIWAPSGTDKLDIAGALAGRPVEVVKCSTVDLEVPAHSEFVLEGEIIPGERRPEGPFGESTGYYFTYQNPVARIKAITHRKDPVYQALVPFTNEESVLLDFSWEMEHLRETQKVYPFVTKVHFSNLGLFAIVQIRKGRDRDSLDITEALLSNRFTKIVIVVDEDIDPYDYQSVNWALATRVRPERDITIKGDMDGLAIDPSTGPLKPSTDKIFSLAARTSKVAIDATKPLDDHERYETIDVPEGIKPKIGSIVARYLSG